MPPNPVFDATINLERDLFLRSLIRELAGTLQDVVGVAEAAGFVSIVGQRLGEHINEEYKRALCLPKLSQHQVTEVLIDLKRRIKGDFYVIEETQDKVVLGNRACPFAEKVEGRQALCMMTSNVFGLIAAENLGYSKVSLERTIAEGHSECRVVVYFSPDGAKQADGREYFRS